MKLGKSNKRDLLLAATIVSLSVTMPMNVAYADNPTPTRGAYAAYTITGGTADDHNFTTSDGSTTSYYKTNLFPLNLLNTVNGSTWWLEGLQENHNFSVVLPNNEIRYFLYGHTKPDGWGDGERQVYDYNDNAAGNSTFYNNRTFSGLNSTVSGGAIDVQGKYQATTGSNLIGTMTADFINNSITNTDTSEKGLGGALHIWGPYAGIETLNSNFINNHITYGTAKSGGGALAIGEGYNQGESTVGLINGNFINNYIDAPSYNLGGAIYYEGSSYGDGEITSIGQDPMHTTKFVGNHILGTGQGGAIYAVNKIGSIYADFIGNYIAGLSDNSKGGAISLTKTSDDKTVGSITGDFIGNYITTSANNGTAYGGAIYNNNSVGSITGDFIGNYVVSEQSDTYGGAIYNAGIITTLTSNFIGNYANGQNVYGGAIYNTGTITNLNGKFIENDAYSNAQNGFNAGGGAIANKSNGVIQNISGDFIRNKAHTSYTSCTSMYPRGGAIYNEGAKIGTINANFIENEAQREAGAIYNDANSSNNNGIGTISGNFIKNKVTGEIERDAKGGAISNTGTIASITNANFTNNTVNSANGYSSYGGAVYNSGTITNGITNSTFTGNIAEIGGAIYNDSLSSIEPLNNVTFYGNSATTANKNAYGGAIYNNGTITSISNATFGGSEEGQGNSATGTGYTAFGGAIYNKSQIGSISANFIANSANGSNGFGGAIFNDGNITSISNSIFDNNSTTATSQNGWDYAGALGNRGTIGNINADFTNNSATGKSAFGGAIYNYSSSVGTKSIGTISKVTNGFVGNSVTATGGEAMGGAIYNKSDYIGSTPSVASILALNTDFTQNHVQATSNAYGGAIYNAYTGSSYYKNYNTSSIGDITGTFTENYAKSTGGTSNAQGGAIYISSGTVGNITADFEGNYAETYKGQAIGGAIAINNASNTVGTIKGTFKDNYAKSTVSSNIENSNGAVGGAIFNNTSDLTILSGSSFTGNYVESERNSGSQNSHGGAIHTSGTLNIAGTTFSGNYAKGKHNATGDGGAIYNYYQDDTSKIATITSSTFTGNYATDDNNSSQGGAIFQRYGNLILEDTSFYNNRANGGAAIYGYGANITAYAKTDDVEFTNNNRTGLADGSGNGLYILGGSLNLKADTGHTLTINDNVFSSNGMTINADSNAGTVALNGALSESSSGEVILNSGTLKLGQNAVSSFGTASNNLNFVANGGTLDIANTNIDDVNFVNAVDIQGNMNLGLDVNLTGTTAEADKITADYTTGNTSVITISAINFINDNYTGSEEEHNLTVADGTIKSLINETVNPTVTGNTNTYSYSYDQDTGILTLTIATYNNIHEAVADDTKPTRTYKIKLAECETVEHAIGAIAGATSNLTINGDNKYLDGDSKGGFIVANGQTLTLKDISSLKNFTTAVDNAGILNVEGVIFTDNTTDINNTATLNLSGINKFNAITGATGNTNINSGATTFTGAINQNEIAMKGGRITVNSGAVITADVKGYEDTPYASEDGTRAIYNNNGTISNITGVFKGNSAALSTTSNIKGGVLYTKNGTVAIDSATFDGNSVKGSSGGYGGAIYSSGTALTITGTSENPTVFKNNGISKYDNNYQGSASGGAIYQTGETLNISNAKFENNVSDFNIKSNSYGGAIYTEATGGNISADFTGNTLSATGGSGQGGAIYNLGTLTKITGDFTNNAITLQPTSSTEQYGESIGGAIYNRYMITDGIEGTFSGNTITTNVKQSDANGGAIANGGTIGDITGDFLNNAVTSTNTTYSGSARGGAIYNLSGTIGNITATNATENGFKGNSATKAAGYNAEGLGGAIYNHAEGYDATIGNITADFINNTATTNGGAIYNYAADNNKAEIGNIIGNFIGNTAYLGSAIYNYVKNDQSYIDNKLAKIGNITGNFSENTGTVIYNKGYYDSNNFNETVYAEIGDITGNFADNNSSGGNVIFNDYAKIGDITGDFTENITNNGVINNSGSIDSITANATNQKGFYQNTGGAIRNYASESYHRNATIGNIIADFKENSASGYSGAAINNTSANANLKAKIGNITGDFDQNASTNYGGAIYNSYGIIGTQNNLSEFTGTAITGNFTNNQVTNNSVANPSGGAITNENSSAIGNIQGNFENNSIINSTYKAMGGAIANRISSTIGNITGNFNTNTISYNPDFDTDTDFAQHYGNSSLGGAIYNDSTSTIGTLTGDFVGNWAKGHVAEDDTTTVFAAAGGAIYNEGTLGTITGDIINNYALGHSHHGVYGGAIYTTTGLNLVDSDITGNYVITQSTSATDLKGGAIYTTDGINITASTKDISVSGNYGTQSGAAIYNSSTEKAVVINATGGNITFENNNSTGNANGTGTGIYSAGGLTINSTAPHYVVINDDMSVNGAFNITGFTDLNGALNLGGKTTVNGGFLHLGSAAANSVFNAVDFENTPTLSIANEHIDTLNISKINGDFNVAGDVALNGSNVVTDAINLTATGSDSVITISGLYVPEGFQTPESFTVDVITGNVAGVTLALSDEVKELFSSDWKPHDYIKDYVYDNDITFDKTEFVDEAWQKEVRETLNVNNDAENARQLVYAKEERNDHHKDSGDISHDAIQVLNSHEGERTLSAVGATANKYTVIELLTPTATGTFSITGKTTGSELDLNHLNGFELSNADTILNLENLTITNIRDNADGQLLSITEENSKANLRNVQVGETEYKAINNTAELNFDGINNIGTGITGEQGVININGGSTRFSDSVVQNAINLKGGRLEVSDGATVIANVIANANEASNYTVSDGYAQGGAIYNAGSISSVSGDFVGNSVTYAGNGFAQGGAIYQETDVLTLDNVRFSNNSAVSELSKAEGGAIIAGYGNPYTPPQITINDSKFINNSARGFTQALGGAIEAAGVTTITDSIFETNSAIVEGISEESDYSIYARGGAVRKDSGSLTINGGKFKSNIVQATATDDTTKAYAIGGALYNNRYIEEMNVDGTTFDGNKAIGEYALGGAIGGYGSIYDDININIENAVFTNNTATSTAGIAQGGAIYYVDDADIDIENSTFTNNTATTVTGIAKGGAIYNEKGNLTIAGSEFTGNKAVNSQGNKYSANGGAIYQKDGVLTITDSTFASNNAADGGGALYIDGGSYEINGTLSGTGNNLTSSTIFEENISGDNGSAITIGNGVSGSINGVVFANNTSAYKHGAAVSYRTASNNTIANSIFDSNEGNIAGAIYNAGTNLTIENTVFKGNSATDDSVVTAGAIYSTSYGIAAETIIKQSEFTGNSGGVIYIKDGTLTFQDSNITNNTGDAIYLLDCDEDNASLSGGTVIANIIAKTSNVNITGNSGYGIVGTKNYDATDSALTLYAQGGDILIEDNTSGGINNNGLALTLNADAGHNIKISDAVASTTGMTINAGESHTGKVILNGNLENAGNITVNAGSLELGTTAVTSLANEIATNTGIVELAGGILTQSIAGNTTITGSDVSIGENGLLVNATIASGAKLTTDASAFTTMSNAGTLLLSGALDKAVLGNGTTNINNSLVLAVGETTKASIAGILNLNDGMLDTTGDNTAVSYNIGTLMGNGSLYIDVDDSGTSDRLIITNNATTPSTVTLGGIHLLNNKTAENVSDFTAQVLSGGNANLAVADALAADYYKSEIQQKTDNITKDVSWTDTFKTWQRTNTRTLSTVKSSEESAVDTLKLATVAGEWQDIGTQGDTLNLINTFVTDDDKTFNFTTATDVYTSSANAGTTVGNLSLNGFASGEDLSTINLNNNAGFTVGETAQLNVSNINLKGNTNLITNNGMLVFTNTNKLEGNITGVGSADIEDGAILTVNNVTQDTIGILGTLKAANVTAGTINFGENGVLDAQDGTATTYTAGSVIGGAGAFNIDVDMSGNTPVSDAINITTGGNNIALTINDIAVNGTLGNFTVDVLKGQTDGATISLAQAVSDHFNYTGNWTDKQESDVLTQTATWDDTFGTRTWEQRDVHTISVVDGTKIDYAQVVQKQNEHEVVGDTIALLTQTTQFGTGERKYVTDSATKSHMTSADFGNVAAGTLTIQGAEEGVNKSSIYMTTHKGFTIGEGATLNLDTIAFKTLALDGEGDLINNTAGTVNMNNVDVATSINNLIRNDSTMNITDSSVKAAVSGTGTTNVKGDSTIYTISQKNIDVAQGATLNTKYLTTTDGVTNAGTIAVSGEALNSNVTGAGTTKFLADVTSTGTISQNNVEIAAGKTLTTTGNVTVANTLTNNGKITLNSENTNLNLNGSNMTNNGTVDGTGTTVVNGNVQNNGTFASKVKVAVNGALTTLANKITGGVENNAQNGLTLTGGDLASNISGTGSTTVSGDVTNTGDKTIANAVTVTSGSLSTDASKVTAGVTNNAALTLTGGNLVSDISGTGITTVSGNITNTNGNSIDNALNVTGSLATAADKLGGAVTNSGTVELTGGELGQTITGGDITISTGAVTANINKLAGNITNTSTLNLLGDLNKAIGGSGTTKLADNISFVDGAEIAGTLDFNGKTLTLSGDNSTNSYNVGKISSDGTVNIDIDFSGATVVSDAINLTASGSTGTITINNVNAIGDSSREFNLNVITGDAGEIQIALSDAVKNQFNKAAETSKYYVADEYQANINFDKTTFDTVEHTKVTQKTIDTQGTSIQYATNTISDEETGVTSKDALATINQNENQTVTNRSLTTTATNKTYTVGDNLGVTGEGSILVQGADDMTSKLDMNGKNGFVESNANTSVTLKNINVIGANSSDGSLINITNTSSSANLDGVTIADNSADIISSNGTVGIKDSTVNAGVNNGVNGTGVLNLNGTNSIDKVAGDGTTNIETGKSIIGSIAQKFINIVSGGKLASSGTVQTTNGITNNSVDGLELTDGATLTSNVTGDGNVKTSGNVQITDGSTISQGVNVTDGKLTTNASSLGGTVTNNGIVELTGGELGSAINGGNTDINGTVSVYDSTGLISSAVEIATNGSLKTNANNVTGAITNNNSLELTGGNIQNTITGTTGTTSITGNVTNTTGQTVTQKAIEIATGGNLSTDADKVTADVSVADSGSYTLTGGANSNKITGEGSTIIAGTVTNTADIESKVAINSGKSLETNADNIKNTVETSGTYKVTGGNIAQNVTGNGTTQIAGTVTNSANVSSDVNITSGSLDNTNGQLGNVTVTNGTLTSNANNVSGTVANNGTYDITGGTISNAISGNGDINILDNVINNAVNTMTGKVNVAEGKTLSLGAESNDMFSSAQSVALNNGSAINTQNGSATTTAINNLVLADGAQATAQTKWGDSINGTAGAGSKLTVTSIDLSQTVGVESAPPEVYTFTNMGAAVALAENIDLTNVSSTTYNIVTYDSTTGNFAGQKSKLVEAIQNTDAGERATYSMNGNETGGGGILEGTLKVQGNGNIIQSDGTSITGSDSIIVGNGTTAGADLILEDVNLGNIVTNGKEGSLVVNGGNKLEYLAQNGAVQISGSDNGVGIYLKEDTNGASTVTLNANGGAIQIADDILSDSVNNVINFNGANAINFSGNFDPLTANVNTTVNRTGGYDDAITYNINAGGILNYTSDTTLYDASHHTALTLNTINFAGGSLDTRNGVVTDFNIANMSLAGTSNFYADVDLANATMDKFTVSNPVTGGGNLKIAGLNLISEATADNTTINFTNDPVLMAATSYTGGDVAYSPIYKYTVDDTTMATTGNLNFVRSANGGYGDYNPGILASPVAAQLGGYLVQLNSYEQAFNNMDMYMLMTKKEREALKLRNKIASLEAAKYDNTKSMYDYNAGWFRPYATFENVPLHNSPKVSNVMYGSFFGGESVMKDLGHGWDGMWGAYIGYNGSHQAYDGVGIYQNGGTLGLVGMAYKDNFFLGGTINTGASAGEASTSFGQDNFTMLMAGAAVKTGYNWELAEGKFIIQPNLQMSYSFVNTFDYTNAAGVRMNSDPLNAIQIEPGVKFIGNLKSGWQPYAGVSMVFNIMDRTHFQANNVSLPNLSVNPYVRYGVGIRKTWGERLTGFFQAFLMNGGRNGVGLQAGFRWAIGKEGSNSKEQLNGKTPELKQTKVSLSSMKTNK